MATLSRTLAQRFARIIRSASTTASATSSSAATAGDNSGAIRRFLQKRPIFQPALPPDHLSYLPSGNELSDRIRSLNQTRIRLDCLSPPPPPSKIELDDNDDKKEIKISVADARKVLRASQMEAVRARLKAVQSPSVSYVEFVRICNEAAGGAETGLQIAQSLDQSGSVIVLGDTVFLRPELVIKAIENFIPQPRPSLNDPLRDELKALEDQKVEIDQQAVAQVRRELWCGLGFLVIQTAAFMRLTFWELSWDVMEPICFYVTSMYFMAGYTFFLRTAKEPSFEGFFHSRFASKQKRLMKAHNFDVKRFIELKTAFGLPELKPSSCSHGISSVSSPSSLCHCH